MKVLFSSLLYTKQIILHAYNFLLLNNDFRKKRMLFIETSLKHCHLPK